jgi:ABC-2 type transport system permease protein
MDDIFRFRIAIQTILDYKKTTIILTLLFMLIAVMYAGMFPAFKEPLKEMGETGLFDSFSSFLGPATFDMATYVGFLNLELYQIFWMIILGIIIGFIAASIVSKEIESKTIDILMSNPISRKQIVFEKFIGLIPMAIVINFGTMLAVVGVTVAIGEELDLGNLLLTHIASIPYFLAILGIAILISVIINEKMKASITFIALLMGMYVIETMSKTVSDYELLGVFSVTHYFVPYDTLKFGEFNVASSLVLICITTVCIVISMIFFEHKDITV